MRSSWPPAHATRGASPSSTASSWRRTRTTGSAGSGRPSSPWPAAGAFAGCFCTSVGGGPADKTGSDALVTELEDGYYIEVLTEKGAACSRTRAWRTARLTGTKQRRQQDAVTKRAPAVARKSALSCLLPTSSGRRPRKNVSRCGACTYLCPTCQCFNITDEQGTTTGERIRSWDSCMFSHFTLEASGHNPTVQESAEAQKQGGTQICLVPGGPRGARVHGLRQMHPLLPGLRGYQPHRARSSRGREETDGAA